jgi:precorrin-8X/cobalt-precorrin-8 methylmutase
MNYRNPQDIEAASMRIIDAEAGAHSFSADQWAIVKRIIHATADFDVMTSIRFHPDAIAAGVAAIKKGAPLYADTEMLAVAIRDNMQRQFGCSVICHVADPDVKNASRTSGTTRSILAVQKAAPRLSCGIIAIGNAPTALAEVITLCQKGAIKPNLVIGMPVGFVGATESKNLLYSSGIVCITMLGRKGGTPATVAVINALMHMAGKA